MAANICQVPGKTRKTDYTTSYHQSPTQNNTRLLLTQYCKRQQPYPVGLKPSSPSDTDKINQRIKNYKCLNFKSVSS